MRASRAVLDGKIRVPSRTPGRETLCLRVGDYIVGMAEQEGTPDPLRGSQDRRAKVMTSVVLWPLPGTPGSA